MTAEQYRKLSVILAFALGAMFVTIIVVPLANDGDNVDANTVQCDTYSVSDRVDCVDGDNGEVVDSFTLRDVATSADIAEDEYVNFNGDIVHLDEICE